MTPLVCYICFNRMGSTVLGLQSLLRTQDDFELYIGDNNSKDKTWDFLMSLKDPRIKEIKRFEHNYGELNIANWSLSHRRPGQDYIIMENDALLYGDFVQHFDRAFREIPNLASASGWLRGIQVDESLLQQGYFYPDTVMGVFTCTKGEVMDKLGFYSEGCYCADVEMNFRIRNLLGLNTGYIKTVDCSLIHPFGSYDCSGCKTRQCVCDRSDNIVLLPLEDRPSDLNRDLYCNRFYPTLNRNFWHEHQGECMRLMYEEIDRRKQVYWESYHTGKPISAWQEIHRKKFQQFFEEQYQLYLATNKLV